jgi:uncharacterized protein (DUF433 family)
MEAEEEAHSYMQPMRIVVERDEPWRGDQASWFSNTRENSAKLFGHLAQGGNLESFRKENPSVGQAWSKSAIHMAHQVLEETAYRAPNHLVHSNRKIMGGTPVFAGTRLPVKMLFDYLLDNYTLAEFADDFPTGDTERLAAALKLACEILNRESLEKEAQEKKSHAPSSG